MTKPEINELLLTPNEYSRPTTKLLSVSKIIIHYVDNPKSTALQNRNFFELRKEGNYGYGSAHCIIDENEIIQAIPFDERAYHVGSDHYTDYALSISSYPNARMVGIEMCHDDESGKPNLGTYKKTLELCAYLCQEYNLNPLEDINTHFDITGVKPNGRVCHKYYVENPNKFTRLKLDVKTRMNKEHRV